MWKNGIVRFASLYNNILKPKRMPKSGGKVLHSLDIRTKRIPNCTDYSDIKLMGHEQNMTSVYQRTNLVLC